MLRNVGVPAARRGGVARTQAAFTLIEVIIAVAVLSIIAVPTSLLLLSLLTGTQQVDDTAQQTAAAQRITSAWVRDVQSVDPTGVNDGPIGTSLCPAVAGDTSYNEANEHILVQFAWDKSSGVSAAATTTTSTTTTTGGPTTTAGLPTSGVKRAVWLLRGSASGSGRDMELVRRSCIGGV